MRRILLLILAVTVGLGAAVLKPNKLLTKEFEPTLFKAATTAIDELDQCEYFQGKYADDYAKYVIWRKKNPTIRFKETSVKWVCAMSLETIQTIWINPDTILTPGCRSLKSTIGHEMLHLAGLPGHDFKDQKNPTQAEILADHIYDIEWHCSF